MKNSNTFLDLREPQIEYIPFNFELDYQQADRWVKQKLTVLVAAGCGRGPMITVIRDKAWAAIVGQTNIERVKVTYRMDGSNQPLTYLQQLLDWIYSWSNRGKQYTHTEYVPIWPRHGVTKK